MQSIQNHELAIGEELPPPQQHQTHYETKTIQHITKISSRILGPIRPRLSNVGHGGLNMSRTLVIMNI